MIDTKKTVRDVAVQYPQALEVFDRYGIDFCCGGGDRLEVAAGNRGVPLSELVMELEEAISQPQEAAEDCRDWASANLTELADHIIKKHHAFMETGLPELDAILATVVRVHGPRHGEVLKPLHRIFRSLKTEIEAHLSKEEQTLFPMIRELEGQGGRCEARPTSADVKLVDCVNETVEEHERVGAALHEMRERTSGFALPEDACPTFARLYEGLEALEHDIHRHIHLENNILFPRAVEMARGARSLPQAGRVPGGAP